MRAKPHKFNDGSWGASVMGSAHVGTRISIRASNGKTWEGIVTKVVVEYEVTKNGTTLVDYRRA